MALHEYFAGTYEYEINVEPMTPPFASGVSYEAKVVRMIRRLNGEVSKFGALYIGASGKTEQEAIDRAKNKVDEWIATQGSKR